ncbi:MAG: response regulator [Candidatus Acidiferrales bacterium]
MSRVLVVEDNAVNQELLCEWLEVEGYQVRSADNLRDAFAEAERFHPDAVLLDVQLGSEDGLLLPIWMREQSTLRHIPVIAVTAHAMAVEQERILQAGCSASVSKPIEFHLLQEQLEKWLTVGALMRRSSELNNEVSRPSISEVVRSGVHHAG